VVTSFGTTTKNIIKGVVTRFDTNKKGKKIEEEIIKCAFL
jgi:hypothetical protein